MEGTTSQKGRLGDERRFRSRVCARNGGWGKWAVGEERVDDRRSERERIKWMPGG